MQSQKKKHYTAEFKASIVSECLAALCQRVVLGQIKCACLLSITSRHRRIILPLCLERFLHVNVVVAGKHPLPQWLTMDEAVVHCTEGIGIWQWASNDQGSEPDVIMACCGDTPTLEVLVAVSLLREHLPALKIRVINVVDLMKLQSNTEHPHGLNDKDYDSLFTKDKHIIFSFHGYP